MKRRDCGDRTRYFDRASSFNGLALKSSFRTNFGVVVGVVGWDRKIIVVSERKCQVDVKKRNLRTKWESNGGPLALGRDALRAWPRLKHCDIS